MVKKGVIVALIFFLIIVFIIASTVAQETEKERIKKAYSWLTTKVKTRALWNALDVHEHVFALLALQCNETYFNPGNSSLYRKAYKGLPAIGTCWGEQDARSEKDCEITETAMAKFTVDRLELFDTEQVSLWLLNQSSFFSNLYWFLELDVERDYNATCAITYEGGETTLKINKDKTLMLTSPSACFSVHEDYWLKIEQVCFEKSFKIKCVVSDETKPFRITLHYKKPLDPKPWFTSAVSQLVESGKWSEEIVLQSYCLVNPGSSACDYEGTAWAALALKENNEDYSKFIPYLIIEKGNNERYLPEALLYLLGVDRYASELKQLQNPPGFWKAEDTVYGQFYDTALAGMTLLGNLSNEKGGAEYYLAFDCDKLHTFKETTDKKYRYWQCAETGCGDVRDTAFILWTFWLEQCPGIAEGCEESGYSCKHECAPDDIPMSALDDTCPFGQVCCMIKGVFECEDKEGVCKLECDKDEFIYPGIICDEPIYDCCKPYDKATSCDEFNGEACEEDYECHDDEVVIADGSKCCLGVCMPEGEYDYCYDVSGTVCSENQVCINPDTRSIIEFVNTTYDKRCCPYDGTCVIADCSAAGGQECKADEVCSIATVETADVKECCTGTCEAKTCEDLGGVECERGYVCEAGKEISPGCCRLGYCEKKAGLWWLWLLIIVIIAAIILLYFYMKKQKEKKKKKPPFGIPPIGPPRRLIPTARPAAPARPRPFPTPTKPPKPTKPMKPMPRGKTEAELEKTLKKLKGMAKK